MRIPTSICSGQGGHFTNLQNLIAGDTVIFLTGEDSGFSAVYKGFEPSEDGKTATLLLGKQGHSAIEIQCAVEDLDPVCHLSLPAEYGKLTVQGSLAQLRLEKRMRDGLDALVEAY